MLSNTSSFLMMMKLLATIFWKIWFGKKEKSNLLVSTDGLYAIMGEEEIVLTIYRWLAAGVVYYYSWSFTKQQLLPFTKIRKVSGVKFW
jgi:hypothetical protein